MKKIEILLVEDEENLHDTLKLNLEMEGYSVSSSYDGAHALKQIQSAHFDLIILDIMLPSLDGFAITETVRLHNIETPILILSAKNTSANRVQLSSFRKQILQSNRLQSMNIDLRAIHLILNYWKPLVIKGRKLL